MTSRTPCPTCSCWYSENPNLFPTLTSAWVHQSLKSINKKIDFIIWLQDNWIHLVKDVEDWRYPRWICQSVKNKILWKISNLGIQDSTLGSQKDLFWLLPASDPDDEPPRPSEITHPPWVLIFEWDTFAIEWDFPLWLPWKPTENMLNLDE